MKKKCIDVRDGSYDDAIDARIYIDEAIWRYENTIRSLLHMRAFIDASVHKDGQDTPEENDDEDADEE